MDDLPTRLRAYRAHDATADALLDEAAAEVERLRKELEIAVIWIDGLPDRVNTMLDDPSAPTTHELLPQLRAALEHTP